MFWWIIGTLITIMMIVFLVATLRILFVFIGRFKANIVLNKSVTKSVFKGKVSLVVILLFFGISFAFVGGMQLVAKGGERSVIEQYNNNNVYKYELYADNATGDEDQILNALARHYNKNTLLSKADTNYMNQERYEIEVKWLYDNKIIEEGSLDKYFEIGNSSPLWDNDYSDWYDNEKHNNINSQADENFRDYLITNFSQIENNENDFENLALISRGYFDTIFVNEIWTQHKDKPYWDELMEVYETFFNSDRYKFASFVSQMSLLSYYKEAITELPFDYEIEGYYNLTPKGSTVNGDFEFVVYNDLFDYDNVQTVNKTEFETKSYADFMDPELESENGINVIVQQDYLEKNNLSIGDHIDFATGVKLNIYDSVRFSEVTYPMMGINVLPDEQKQAFVGIKASDFLKIHSLLSEEQYSSLYNRTMSVFIAPKENKNYSIEDWTGTNDTFKVLREETLGDDYLQMNKNLSAFKINQDELSKFVHINGYEMDIPNFSEQADWLVDKDSGNYYYGVGINLNETYSISEYKSAESFRALMGAVEMIGTQSMIRILVIIFMVIILIVLSMLISKRINDSGKQLGTLKAMGMKNKQIASSYILYPIIIISLGFVVASLLSPIVMFLFQNLMSKFYYISFSAFPLSFGFFWTIFFIPLILSIGLCYFISIRVLRKPTLDLLSNKGKDAPNVFVRAAGYVTPAKTPFAISYAGKGILRAMGKSMLLFISIFLSVFLTSFAMSTTTMIKNQTDNAMSYLNFESFSAGQNKNLGQYNVEYMFNEDGSIAYEELDAITIDGLLRSDVLGEKSISFDDYYSDAIDYINISFEGKTLSINNGEIESSFYITSEYMSALTISYFLLEKTYNATHPFTTDTFVDYEKSLDSSKIRYYELSPMVYRWFVQSAETVYENTNGIKHINDLTNSELLNLIGLLPDVVFGDYYFNQYEETVVAAPAILSERRAINDSERNNWESAVDADVEDDGYLVDTNGTEWILGSVLSGKDGFINCWGTKDNGKGEQLWADTFEDDYNKVINGESLGYIPVIASTQAQMQLDEWADEEYSNGKVITTRNEVKDGKNTYNEYVVSMEAQTYSKTSGGEYFLSKTPIKVKIRVMNTLFVGVDMGINTVDTFVQSYLYNYVDNSKAWEGTEPPSDGSLNSWVDDKENPTVFTYKDKWNGNKTFVPVGTPVEGETSAYNLAFNTNKEVTYKYKDYKTSNGKEVPQKATPLSVALTEDMYESLWNGDVTKAMTLVSGATTASAIFDKDSDWYYSDAFKAANGTQVNIEALISQGAKAYDMIMGMFMIMSIFIIFMATTIIVISMKDVIDSSKREVSMLKAFGYSNTRATILIMIPYIIVAALAFVIALPLTFGGLASVAAILTSATGNTFIFTLTALQWFLVCGYVFGLIGILTALGFISFYRTNALEAIKATDE